MGKPSFHVFVGIKGPFVEEDLNKLPLQLRKSYSLCPEWGGEKSIFHELEFDSFHLGLQDTADPGEYVGFGVCVFGQWYDGETEFSIDIQGIESTRQKVTTLFSQLNISAKVDVFCFAGYNS